MKKIPLLLFSLILIIHSSISQIDVQSIPEGTSFPNHVNHVFEHIDLSQVPTGLLEDYAMRLIPLERYDGQSLEDSTALDLNSFSRIYYRLTGASVSNNILPHPDSFYQTNTSAIPFGVLLFKYNRLRPDVIDEGILDTLNGQLHHIVGNTQSPYLQDTLLAINPLKSIVTTLDMYFVLSAEKMFNNLGSSISSIQIDWDDGNGNQTYSVGDTILFTYSEGGEKNITTTIALANNETYTSHFNFLVDVTNVSEFNGGGGEGYPDFQNYPQEAFVIFINDGKNNFTAHTITQFAEGRWMRFVTADLDGDKDVDILLSAMNIKTPEVPRAVADKWAAADNAIIFLENTTK